MTGPAVPQGRRAAPDAGPGAAGVTQARTARGGWLPYLLALGCAVFGLGWMWVGGAHAAKGGTLALAGAMFVAALARLVLPESRIGMLASRKRYIDVATMAALGAGLLAAGLLLSMTT
jgi:Protein of unknown function (DUF3017)